MHGPCLGRAGGGDSGGSQATCPEAACEPRRRVGCAEGRLGAPPAGKTPGWKECGCKYTLEKKRKRAWFAATI